MKERVKKETGGNKQSPLERKARKMLAQAADITQSLNLAMDLAQEGAFGLARRLLEHARQRPAIPPTPRQALQLSQQLALCILKDPDLPADSRRDQALAILNAAASDRESPAEQGLVEQLFEGHADLDALKVGKIGLALSGGGFRASLFHIGVLARLAECDLLRHVEVISCVSGGAILGAHYYLQLRQLLQSKPESEIDRKDYVDLVKKLEKDFLEGVQTNIRVSIAQSLKKNWRMLTDPNYSRTTRVGELYEERLFSKADGQREHYLNDLKIQPCGEPEGFTPKTHNWRRKAKVPILILNATTLNTGHNWQFTASWMGEPQSGIDKEIDSSYYLRRMRYEDAPEDYRRVRLGDAVAASSCVPGIFEPLCMPNLYPNTRLELVDGGVYDNQGTSSLLEQGCTLLLVSDASGQMNSQDKPDTGLMGIPARSNEILQARVRSAQFQELEARRESGLLHGLMFIHLKKDLDVLPRDWIDCPSPSPPAKSDGLTSYGINKKYQQALSGIRTDLDSFSNNEAWSLMLSGYRMTEHCLPTPLGEGGLREAWRFMAINPSLSRKTLPSLDNLLWQLRVGEKKAFKPWFVSRKLQILGGLGTSAAILSACTVFLQAPWLIFSSTLALAGLALALLLLGVIADKLGIKKLLSILGLPKTLRELAIGALCLAAGLTLVPLHLRYFDKVFLRHCESPPEPSAAEQQPAAIPRGTGN